MALNDLKWLLFSISLFFLCQMASKGLLIWEIWPKMTENWAKYAKIKLFDILTKIEQSQSADFDWKWLQTINLLLHYVFQQFPKFSNISNFYNFSNFSYSIFAGVQYSIRLVFMENAIDFIFIDIWYMFFIALEGQYS